MSTQSMQIALNRDVPLSRDEAARGYVEPSAVYEVSNRWYRLALIAACCALALQGAALYRQSVALSNRKPLVVRVNELGQPSASAEVAGYQPREAELKYFLGSWMHDHYGRVRATRREAAVRELYFLAEPLGRIEDEENKRTNRVAAFLSSGDDEVSINVLNISFEDIRTAPYKATVNYERVFRGSDGREVKRVRAVAHIVCSVMAGLPNDFALVNPLGLVITYFRSDEAF
jgi:type IV secretory pathway TrbF-like protein